MEWAHYKKLIAWQKAMDLTDEIYRLVKYLPAEERFALSDQMRRSAVSVPSNIAEGYGRHTENEFKEYLAIARGSVFELETQLTICQRQSFLSEDQIKRAVFLCDELGRMLTALSKH